MRTLKVSQELRHVRLPDLYSWSMPAWSVATSRWEPLPDPVFEAMSPKAQRRFAHAHHWDSVDAEKPFAPFPYGARHTEMFVTGQRR